MRLHGRIDRNHNEIRHVLEKCGVSVQSLANVGHGCPDLLCGFRKQNYLFEVKDGLLSPSRRVLTYAEVEWQLHWSGQVQIIKSPDDALRILEL